MADARTIEIKNERGLHARAAAKFVKLVAEYDTEVSVSKDGQTVLGTSIMGLMMLAAGLGDSIRVTAEGPDSKAVLDALESLIGDKFEEE